MDIPRKRPEPTWRDTPWWLATRQALLSGVLMTLIAAPMVGWFGSTLLCLSNMPFNFSLFLSELGKGTLVMLPYLWSYFFALEWIARSRSKEDSIRL